MEYPLAYVTFTVAWKVPVAKGRVKRGRSASVASATKEEQPAPKKANSKSKELSKTRIVSAYMVASEQNSHTSCEEKWWVTGSRDGYQWKLLTKCIASKARHRKGRASQDPMATVAGSNPVVQPSFKIVIPALKRVKALEEGGEADRGEPTAMAIDSDAEVQGLLNTVGSKSGGFALVFFKVEICITHKVPQRRSQERDQAPQ